MLVLFRLGCCMLSGLKLLRYWIWRGMRGMGSIIFNGSMVGHSPSSHRAISVCCAILFVFLGFWLDAWLC